jgi:hypothetical protein
MLRKSFDRQHQAELSTLTDTKHHARQNKHNTCYIHPVNAFLLPPPAFHRLLNMASPILTFRLMDLPPEIFTQVMNTVDETAMASARTTCTHFKKRIDRRFYTTFFTEIESSLTQDMLERLLWLSEQSHLAFRVKSLMFAISNDHTPHLYHAMISKVMNNLSEHGNITTLGVISKSWDHPEFSRHGEEMAKFLTDHLVPHRNTIKPCTWKIVVRINNLREDRDLHFHDCLGYIENFVDSELLRGSVTPQGIDLEIHERAGDPTRYIEVTKNSAFAAHTTLKNFNCEDFHSARLHSLDDAMFMEKWNTDTLAIKDSVFLQESLIHATLLNPTLRHLSIENVQLRGFIDDEFHIEPVDWIETLQACHLDDLQSCRFVDLLDSNGKIFVEGVWEFTATSGQTVSEAIAGHIDNIQRARLLGSQSELQ